MADEFEQYKVTQPSGDEFAQYKVGGVQSPISAPVYHPSMAVTPQRIDPIGSRPEADVKAGIAAKGPINTFVNSLNAAAQDAVTLTRSGYQAAAKGITGHAILGEPASNEQLIRSGANMAAGMAMGSEGQPPTPRLNAALNDAAGGIPRIPMSDPSFSIGRKLAGEIPGIGGVLRKIDLFKAITDTPQAKAITPDIFHKMMGETAPPEVRQAWAMQQGGQPAPASQTGEALGSLNVPRGTPQQVAINGSGGGPDSLEAASRTASEKAAGTTRIVRDTRSNAIRPLIGPDAVDYQPQPYESVEFNGGTRHGEIIAQGSKVRPTPQVTELQIPQSKAPVQPPFPGPKTYDVVEGRDPITHPFAPKEWHFDQDYSSNIKQYGYNKESGVLSVIYKRGNAYQFKATPQMFNELRNAPRAGVYMKQVIEPAQARGVGRSIGTIKEKMSPGELAKQALGGKSSSGF